MEMMVHGRDEQWSHRHHLGLSLSLGIDSGAAASAVDEPPPCRADLSVAPVSSLPAAAQSQCWNNGAGLVSSSSGERAYMHADRRMATACHDDEIPLLRGIDVNRPAAPERRSCSQEEDEDPGASSPNSTLSSLSGKRGAPPERAGAGAGSDDEDSSPSGSRKKLRLSKDQAAVLEDTFKEHNTLNPKQKAVLARQLKLTARQVEVWFQNRRARTKLKQTEVDCELLKRCCETLTEENRRLHKELHDLRALSLYTRMPPPPTTLTICPSCGPAATGGEGPARSAPTRTWGPAPIRPLFVDRPAQRTSTA